MMRIQYGNSWQFPDTSPKREFAWQAGIWEAEAPTLERRGEASSITLPVLHIIFCVYTRTHGVINALVLECDLCFTSCWYSFRMFCFSETYKTGEKCNPRSSRQAGRQQQPPTPAGETKHLTVGEADCEWRGSSGAGAAARRHVHLQTEGLLESIKRQRGM